MLISLLISGFFAAFLVSMVVTPLVRQSAGWLGLVDLPGDRKVHSTPTPMGGGIAVFAGLLIPSLAVVLGLGVGDVPVSRFLSQEIQGTPELSGQVWGVVLGGLILFLVGLADDRWNLSWKPRLLLQLFVAIGVTMSGVKATVFVAQPWIGFGITVLWILVLTNAMNFLDNMDGLSAGIGVIASLVSAVILLVMIQQPQLTVAFGLLLLAGALSGFLVWNRPPATIFMGDSGSNLIGFLLATLTIMGTFYDRAGSRHVILAPLCILAIPLYDFVSVILIRIRSGRSPFQGDKSHFSHRLVELGLRPSRAVLTIHLATLMTGIGALLLYRVNDWSGAWLIIALIACVLILISILETVGRRSLRAPSATGSGLVSADRDSTKREGSRR
ncbi:MAG: MraY family glycosyltransferase [Fuerstiella sp.]